MTSQAQLDTADGLAYRYALATLNPFVITGDASIYASHTANGELDLYDPATGQGAITDQYLKDRAKMLSWKMKYDVGAEDADDDLLGLFSRDNKPYGEDWGSWTIREDWDFVDHSLMVDGAPLRLTIDGIDPITQTANHQIAFGSKYSDSLGGGKLNDNLYGGAGDDTYLINAGGGTDILDSEWRFEA